MFAPVGGLEGFHPEGAAPVVRGAKEFGVAHMLSSVCDPGIEKTRKPRPMRCVSFSSTCAADDAFVDDFVNRAIANGYSAFCLTVDTAVYSRRERDIAKRHVTAGRRRASGRDFQAALDWRTVKRLKDRFKIPLAIKGIATAEDAKIAVEHGVDWIYVSNHGGRQLDHGRGSMDVLPEIVDAVAAAPRFWSTARSAAAATSSRRSPPAPIWSASAACSALRSRRPGRPASCACSNCWRMRRSAVSACSGQEFCRARPVVSAPRRVDHIAARPERVPAAQAR